MTGSRAVMLKAGCACSDSEVVELSLRERGDAHVNVVCKEVLRDLLS